MSFQSSFFFLGWLLILNILCPLPKLLMSMLP